VQQSAPAHERVGLVAFVAHIQKERDRERVILIKELNRLEQSNFTTDFAAMIGDDPEQTANG
jgi:hypothetical protein